MTGAPQVVAGVLALVGASFRIGLWRRLPPRSEGRYLLAFMVGLGLAMVLIPFARVPAGQAPTPLTRAVPLLCTELKLIAECSVALLVHTVRYGGAHRSRVRLQAAVSALVMVAAALLYGAAAPTLVGHELVVGDGARLPMALYDLLFTGHSLWCSCLYTVVVHRSARQLGPGPLRTGLRLVTAGGAAGVVWSAQSVEPLLSVLRTGRNPLVGDASAALATLVLCTAGLTLTAWEGRLTALLRRLRARRSHRRIGPLWAALHAARPDISFVLPGASGGPPGLALYRRVIEIRDAQLALRPYVHPEASRWAAEACAAEDERQRRAATVEAAVVAAALEASAAGRRFPRAAEPEPAGGEPPTDLAAEADWLILVCEAFVHSPVVADVRRRVRAELGTG